MNNKTKTKIVESVGDKFSTFGGGQYSNLLNNPIAYALKDKPLQFAAGVDVKEVVEFVVKEYLKNIKK